MKKYLVKFICIPAIVLAVSCQMADIDRVVNGAATVTATLEGGLSTRTSLGGDGKVLWSAGDEVALMSSSTNDKFTLTKGDGTSSAEFIGTMSGPTPFYLLYPYSDGCSVADGKLKFTLPQEQTVSGDGSFGQGASPAVAYMADYGSPAQFKNICGAVELNLTGTCKVSSIVLSDLSGSKLWGDCELVLDGKQGTDEQTLNITGGSNSITLKLSAETELSESTPKTFVAIVPAGSMSKGFTVKLLDATGKALSFFTVQNAKVVTHRSKVTCMTQTAVPDNGEPLDTLARGHYKEVFMDSGVFLSTYLTLPAAPYLGWEFDTMTTEKEASYTSSEDKAFQKNVLLGNDDDYNGALLYPDNAPRYRMIYVNGGRSSNHGNSLGEEGRSRIITFVKNGGSYVGTCAGAYLATMGSNDVIDTNYLHLMPCFPTQMLYGGTVGMTITDGSPLLNYYNFGGDKYVASVNYVQGCYLLDDHLPEGGEILMRYDKSSKPEMHGRISGWAYKESPATGRLVVTGGHPEQYTDGERRDLMAAMMRYACDGGGSVVNIKAELSNGQTRLMNKKSTNNLPEYACIGDKQYHHFKVTVPAGAKNFKLSAVCAKKHTIHLALRKAAVAWRTDADYLLVQDGTDKTLTIDSIEPGEWYVSVYCPEFLPVTCGINTFEYPAGDHSVLNGISYKITASWE